MIRRLLKVPPMNRIPVFFGIERFLASLRPSSVVVANWYESFGSVSQPNDEFTTRCKSQMTATIFSLLCLAVVIFVPFEAVRAQQEDVVASGQQLFNQKCTVCHGHEGKGDGVLGQHLKRQPEDLSRLSKRNGDAFPFWLAYAKIDGREIVDEHGASDMPVWGTDEMYTGSGGRLTMGQILEIVFFLKSIQEE